MYVFAETCDQTTYEQPEVVARRCSVKKMFLNCARVSFLIKLQVLASNFIKEESLAKVFSCEFCEISKNTFFTEHL